MVVDVVELPVVPIVVEVKGPSILSIVVGAVELSRS